MIKGTQVDTSEILLNAAVDAELDPMRMLELENQVAADPELRGRYEALSSLSHSMRACAAEYAAPKALRDRIEAMASPARHGTPSESWPSWARSRQAVAASVVGAFCLGAASMLGASNLARLSEPDQIASVLVDDHRRALLAREPIDVASSDRHTVKPWFDERLALSPSVVDLSTHGYELVGGRADVVNGVPAPTLVYRLRGHLISVTAIPIAQGRRASLVSTAINGYVAKSWTDQSFAYWAVSDIPNAELDAFVSAFRTAS